MLNTPSPVNVASSVKNTFDETRLLVVVNTTWQIQHAVDNRQYFSHVRAECEMDIESFHAARDTPSFDLHEEHLLQHVFVDVVLLVRVSYRSRAACIRSR